MEAEFVREHAAMPRIVFSDSLTSVAPGCRLVRRADAIDEVVWLKGGGRRRAVGRRRRSGCVAAGPDRRVPPKGGASFTGGGKPYFRLGADLRLRLVEQRTFRDGTVYLRCEREPWSALIHTR